MNPEEKRKRGEAAQYHTRRHRMRDFHSMQPAGHPHNMAYHHGQQPNQYWLNYNHQNTSPFPGPRHFYPMRQMFVQHGPFGSTGNRFLPAPLPHFPNPMHLPPHVPSPNYNNEHRRSRNHPDNDHVHDMPRFYQNGHGRNFGHDRSLRYELGQGARPKTHSGRFQRDKNRTARKKRHLTSNSLTQNSSTTEEETLLASKEVSEQPDVCSADHESDFHFPSSQKNEGKSDHVRAKNIPEQESKECIPVSIEDGDLEGAVGGAESVENFDPVQPHLDHQDADPCVYDKNLIDEGAICDLDSMFLNQEASGSNGDLRSFYMSDEYEDGDCDNIRLSQNLDSFTQLDSDKLTGDNCSIEKQDRPVFPETLRLPTAPFSSPCSPSKSLLSFPGPQQDFKSNGERVNDFVRNEMEDAEDTGDFIDTDLPAQCLLSSSDEMDNESSSEQEEDPPFLPDDHMSLKPSGSDINCNDLPSSGSIIGSEALEDIKTRTSKLQLSCFPPSAPSSQSNVLKPFEYKRRKRQCNTCAVSGYNPYSSDSETDESYKASIPSAEKPKARNCAPIYCSPADFCGDGAAASQVILEENQQRPNRAGNGNIPHLSPRLPVSPPGADSEVPLPPERFFVNIGAIPAPLGVAILPEGPGPSAVTANCEPSPAEACSLSARPEPSSCSTTASGGACHQQVQASGDSSACSQARGKSMSLDQVGSGNTAADNSQLLEGDSYSASSYNAEMVCI